MSGPVIIRLQNLPLEARSIDIRRFFEGLVIPDGGVHIIGGEKGDAFIAFHSDEDARQAMSRDGYLLCNSKIKLYLSSKTEMQNVIATARNQQPPTATAPTKSLFNSDSAIDLLKTNSLSQILNMNSSQSSQTSTLGSNSTNTIDILSSLTKLISNNQTSNAPVSLMTANLNSSRLAATHIENNNTPSSSSSFLDQFKGIQNAPVTKLNNDTGSDQLTSLLAKVSNLNKPATSEPKPNISIDQILNLIQSQVQSSSSSSVGLQSLISTNSNDPKKNSYNSNSNNYMDNRNDQDDSNRSNMFNNRPGQLNSYNRFNNNNNNNNNNNFNQKYQNNKRRFDENNDSNSSWRENNNYSNIDKQQQPQPQSQLNNKTYQQRQQLDPIIKVRNFNNNCSYKDIRTFLQGIQIEHDGIKLLTDPNGHRNGTAFVKLMTITDLKKALCRNGQFYEENSITVSQATESEFVNAPFVFTFKNHNNNNNNNNNIINNKNINNNNINTPNNISNPTDDSKRNNQFQNQRFNNNLNNPNNNNLKRNINETQSKPIIGNPKVTDTEQQQQQQQQLQINTNIDPNNVGFYFKIYGLPANFDEQNLRSMFNNVKFVRIVTSTPTPITSTNTNNGTTEQTITIKAKKLCQVETQLDLERALTRQDERVGKSKLQIFQISRSEFDRELANLNKNNYNINYNQSVESDSNSQDNLADDDASQEDDDLFVYMSGVPFSAKEQDVRFFFQGLSLVLIHLLVDNQTQKPTGECLCQFNSRQDRDTALEKDNQLFRNRVVKVKPISHSDFSNLLTSKISFRQRNKTTIKNIPSLFGGSNNASNDADENEYDNNDFDSENQFNDSNSNDGLDNKFNKNGIKRRMPTNIYSSDSNEMPMNKRQKNFTPRNFKMNYNENDDASDEYGMSPNSVLPPLPPELQRHRNKLILFSNIAHEASREDILELVKQYQPIEQTLKIRHDDLGNPTGDAIVACVTPENAINACASLNGSDFLGKYIKAILYNS